MRITREAGSMIRYTWFDSPIGALLAAARESGLCLLHFERGASTDEYAVGLLSSLYPDEELSADPGAPHLVQTRELVLDYLEDATPIPQPPPVPLDLSAGTEFQQAVWRALLEIPFGETRTYGQVAQRIGKPAASRAVGGACGRNPIGLVVPCHRVIGSNGKLVGFGGGLGVKERLLTLERDARQRT